MIDTLLTPTDENVGSATLRRRSGFGEQEAVPTLGRRGRLPYVGDRTMGVYFHGKKSEKPCFSSFRRRPESRKTKDFWTPAFAGVTALMTFYEFIKRQAFIFLRDSCGNVSTGLEVSWN